MYITTTRVTPKVFRDVLHHGTSTTSTLIPTTTTTTVVHIPRRTNRTLLSWQSLSTTTRATSMNTSSMRLLLASTSHTQQRRFLQQQQQQQRQRQHLLYRHNHQQHRHHYCSFTTVGSCYHSMSVTPTKINHSNHKNITTMTTTTLPNNNNNNNTNTNQTKQALIPFLLADIGEGIKEVEILKWYIKPGDSIQQFDIICQVQSDKATVDITSRYDGIIAQLGNDTSVEEGCIIQVGQPLVYFYPNDDNDNDIDTTSNHSNNSISNKTDTMIPSQQQSLSSESQTSPLMNDDEDHDDSDHNQEQDNDTNNNTDSHTLNDTTTTTIALTTPAVRKIAREHNIHNEQLVLLMKQIGTGPNQRILKSDLLSYLQQQQQNEKTNEIKQNNTITTNENNNANTTSNNNNNTNNHNDQDQIIQLRGYTRTMIQTMTKSLQIPHMCFGDEIILNQLLLLQKQINLNYQKNNSNTQQPNQQSSLSTTIPKITLFALLIKAVSLALLDYPILNSIQTENSVIDGILLQKQDHNIGIAIDTPKRGLVVPVLYQCQNKSILQIQNDINLLKELAYNNQLQKDIHLSNCTFTISNIGSIGSGMFMHPIIVEPTISMGTFGYMKTIPRYRTIPIDNNNENENNNENIYPANVMTITWAGDHRFIDGATLGRFHNRFKYYVEEQCISLLLL